MNAMAEPELKTASPLQVAKAVFWSFFGVRRRREHEKDLAQIKPAQLRPHDPASADLQRQAAADSLDFGQFWHRPAGGERRGRRVVARTTPPGYLPAR